MPTVADYVDKVLGDRRRAPRDDFLSDFLTRADAAGELSLIEIMFQIVQLIVGGTDTTRVVIVMQVRASAPTQMAGAIHRCRETRWVKPVRPGHTIQPTANGNSKQTTAHSRWVSIDVMVRNRNTERVATGEAVVEFLFFLSLPCEFNGMWQVTAGAAMVAVGRIDWARAGLD